MIDLPPATTTTSSNSGSTPATAVSTPLNGPTESHAAELAFKMEGLVSQEVSDDEDEDGEDETHHRMSRSVRSLVASTPDLESDRESVGRMSVVSREGSPA